MRPKLPELNVVPGLFSTVWFRTLKNSALNCNFKRSAIGIFFCAEKSMLTVPGPRRMLRPEFPKVPGAFVRKEEVVNHFWMFCPVEPPVYEGVEIKSAVSFPIPVKELSSPELMVSGKPLCQFQMPVVCQFPNNWRNPFALGVGSCQTSFSMSRRLIS